MIEKKHPSKKLENKRVLFFETGLIIVLALTLIAFEWETKSGSSSINFSSGTVFEEEFEMPSTTRKSEPQEPKFEIPTFEIIENYEDPILEDPLDGWTSEIGLTDPIEYVKRIPEEETTEPIPFYKVEDLPKFKGKSHKEFNKYIISRIVFPQEAINLGLKGKIEVSFVVNTNGEVADVKVIRSVDPMLDQIVVNLVNNSPKWTPGSQRGIPVNVSFKLPVSFSFE